VIVPRGHTDVPQSVLDKGEVVTARFNTQVIMKYSTGDSHSRIAVGPYLRSDAEGAYASFLGGVGTSLNIFTLHLGETKTLSGGGIGSVTLLAFPPGGVKLLLVPRQYPLVKESVSVPGSELSKGKVLDVKVGSRVHVDGGDTYEDSLTVYRPLGSDKGGVTVSVGAGGNSVVSIHLGEAKDFDGFGSVTVLAFEEVDGVQGVRLLVVPEQESK
jgi:hypothetical protein